ncbi:MAG: citrate synthase [Aaplasma endosymbiont of Hyalomma asiaticum]
MVKSAVLEYGDSRISLPVICGTDGVEVVDITALYREHKVLTYDPGFMSTAACRSEITFIDGDKGILRYRGIAIEDLINVKGGFCSIAYLLLKGVLPSPQELEEFSKSLQDEYVLPESVVNVVRSFPRNSHPMTILIASFAALAAHYHGRGINPLELAAIAVAKTPGIVATIHRHVSNQEFVQAATNLEYSLYFVEMLFGNMDTTKRRVIFKALDAIFIMHADHEQNASTATVRMAGSSGADLFACLCAGASSLWGSAHGGANEAVIKMLEEIAVPENVTEFIEKVKDNKNKVRLMGFGHRVYKSYDPRAKILREICREVLNTLGQNDRLLDVAEELERRALEDAYFIERKLYPNVDFYSGIVLRAIGVPVKMYTVFFALARTTGWASQWYEMVHSVEGVKICRPRQLYMGK